jgi:hypothetical protein
MVVIAIASVPEYYQKATPSAKGETDSEWAECGTVTFPKLMEKEQAAVIAMPSA